jgi:hypothetical protein
MMHIDDVRKLPPVERLLYFIRERHQVYMRRQAGLPKPWTDDAILQTVFFTNPYRENDRVTRWYAQHIRKPLCASDRPERVVFATIAFRWFNRPETGEILMGHGAGRSPREDNLLFNGWDEAEAVRRLSQARAAKEQIFTGAFNISNGGSTKGKVERVCEDYITPAHNHLREWMLDDIKEGLYQRKLTLGGLHDLLSDLPGMGGSGFMAAQIVADLKYTWVAERAPDWWTWCCLGPGSKKGLNIVMGRSANAPVPHDWQRELNNLRERVYRRLKGQPALHAQDLQNCLCELSKYQRALDGGHVKRGYPGARDDQPVLPV